jgi:hypothetical protein
MLSQISDMFLDINVLSDKERNVMDRNPWYPYRMTKYLGFLGKLTP